MKEIRPVSFLGVGLPAHQDELVTHPFSSLECRAHLPPNVPEWLSRMHMLHNGENSASADSRVPRHQFLRSFILELWVLPSYGAVCLNPHAGGEGGVAP